MTVLTTLVLAAAKTIVLLAVAAVLAAALRRASARVRSLVWATAICGSLLLPVLAAVGPALEIGVTLPRVPESATASKYVDSSAGTAADAGTSTARAAVPGSPAPHRADPARLLQLLWPSLGVGVWLAGAAVVLLRQAAGWWRAIGAVRRGPALEDPVWTAALERARRRAGCRRPIRLLASPEVSVPATLGLVAPVVILPTHSRRWLADSREAVLLHEVVHVARGDWLVRTLARLALAAYWYNPLAWWAVRRLELEQELACDEAVLALGERPTDYANHLLGIARLVGRSPICPIPVTGMAHRHDVEERIMAILERPRTRPATRTTLTAAVVTIAALVPVVAAVQPAVRHAGSELAQALDELRDVEERLEPYHQRLEEAAREIELEAEDLESVELVNEEAILEIERQMQPYLDRIADLQIDMEPYQEQIEEAGRRIESIELDIERGTIDDIHRQIEEQLKPQLAAIEKIHIDLEPLHEQLEAIHRELEPLYGRLAAVHEQMAPHHEQIEKIHERMAPMHEAMEAMHDEMEPLHRELEEKARRVEKALAIEVEAELRERLGAVVGPGAPWNEAASRIVDEGSLHIDDDLVRLNASRSEVREILTDLMKPHHIGAEDAFTAALEDTVREISRFEVEVR